MKKSHWITLIVLVILLLVYFVARQKQPTLKEQRLFKADSTEVTKLEFVNVDDTVVVVKTKDAFRLSYPMDWEVNEPQITNFYKQVLPIKTSTTPMSEDKNLQSMYRVDAKQAVQVKLYNADGKLLDHVYIGNGTNSGFDYCRREGENKIYQFKINITNFVKPDIFQWRSPNITNIKQKDINYIDVVYTKNAYTLTVKQDTLIYKDKRESFAIPVYNRAQWKVINALENLMTYQFIDKKTEQYAAGFDNPDCRVSVHLKNGKVRTFEMIRMADKSVLLRVDSNMKTLYMMTGDFINRFTRAAMHYKMEFD